MLCPACDHDNIPGEDLCVRCGLDLAGLDVAAWNVDLDDRLLATHLEDLPLKPPLVFPPTASVIAAIDRMKEKHEGCVFVQEDDRLVGVFTEHDVTARVAAPGRDPARTRLDEVMTRDPIVLQKSDPLAWALHRMGVDGYRHLPVMHEERLVGFLSIRTVIQAFLDA